MRKIRPYTPDRMSSLHLCAIRRKGTTSNYTITGWDDEFVQTSKPEWVTYEQLLNEFEFADGTIIGV